MTDKKNTERVDRAWKLLYDRLESDGLLPDEKVSVHRRFSKTSSYRWAGMLAAACIFAVVVVMLKPGVGGSSKTNLTLVNHEKDVNLVTTLADGSVVYLVEQASLSYPRYFEDNRREVMLEGEAFFDINKDEGKPFVVETELVSVEVLGTAFNIINTDEVPFSLSVLRGKVRVINKMNDDVKIVESGQTVFLDNGKMESSEDFDFERFDIYLNNLHFKDEKLSNIVRVINSKSDSIKIVLSPELDNRLLNITFKDETPVAMAELICLGLNLHYSRAEDTIIISQR